MYFQTIQGNPDSDAEDHSFGLPSSPSKRARIGRKKEEPEEKVSKTRSGKTPGRPAKASTSTKKEEESPVKRGRGRPKKSGDSFPYSEIKEIIAASKKTDKVKRGRGRPPKCLPPPSITRSGTERKGEKAKEVASDETPLRSGRYGTRGIKRNYLEMSAGKTEIKKEVMSDEEDEEEESDVEEGSVEDVEASPRKRGRPRKKPVESASESYEEMVNEDAEDDYLDDNEQEELDEEISGAENEDNQEIDTTVESLDGSPVKKVVVVTPNKSGEGKNVMDRKITDSVVRSLRTSNVSTSVPTIAKVGIRTVKVGKRKPADDEEVMEKELEKAVEAANVDSLHCSLCDDYRADTFSDLTAHLKTFHHVYEPPRCDICEIDFDTANRLSLHIDRKHGPKMEPASYKCWYEGCVKVFLSQVGLTGHVNKVHLGQPVAEKKYECEKCPFKTKSREDLWEHKKVAHNEQIECKPCNMVFVNFQTLKAHNSLKHSEDGQQMCYICGKEFSSKLSLQRHLRLHNQQMYTCNICSKNVSTKASFQDHMERHKPERERKYKFYCAYCGKGFSVKSNYEDHQNKHTGNKPYKCNMCSKTFGFRSMLKKHKTFVHSSERPYKCGYCMKGFKFMNLLKNHVTIHTNKSKHVCTYCSKVFSTASTLKIHLRKCGSIAASAGNQSDNMIVMYADTATTSSLTDHGQIVISNPTSLLSQSSDIMTNMAVVSDPTGNLQTDNISLSETTGLTSEITPPSEIEMYACSECNSTFATFQEAEAHVLTAHSVGAST